MDHCEILCGSLGRLSSLLLEPTRRLCCEASNTYMPTTLSIVTSRCVSVCVCPCVCWLIVPHAPYRLQSANILVDQDGVAKLADFGCSTHASNDIQEQVVGTPYFMAPELLTERTIAPPIDIWALGCTGT